MEQLQQQQEHNETFMPASSVPPALSSQVHNAPMTSGCDASQNDDLKAATAMFSACVAANHCWQWQYSVSLAKQQLQILETLLQRPQRRYFPRRRVKRVVSQWSAATSESGNTRGHPLHHHSSGDGAGSNATDTELSKGHAIPTWQGVSINFNVRQPSTSVIDEPINQGDYRTRSEGVSSSTEAGPPAGDARPLTASESAATAEAGGSPVNARQASQHRGAPQPRQGARNLIERYPIVTYVKLCVVLFFLNAPVYVIAVVGVCAVVHIAGAFDSLLERLYWWCERAGFTQRRPFVELLAELRSQRLERLQQEQAVAQASQVYRELQHQSRNVSGTAVDGHDQELHPHNDTPPATTIEEAQNDENVTSASVSPGAIQSTASHVVFCIARWFYQLFVVFFCSLNPQWSPLTAFVLPDPLPPREDQAVLSAREAAVQEERSPLTIPNSVEPEVSAAADPVADARERPSAHHDNASVNDTSSVSTATTVTTTTSQFDSGASQDPAVTTTS